jgi:hypothetical protein
MLDRLIEWSARNVFLVLLATLAVVAGGIYAVKNTPLDALPDLSDVQVIVFTPYAGQAPKVVEDQVTYPLTTAMLAVPKAKVVRGFSMFGASYVYVIFADGTDIYWARSRVLEYLSSVQGNLPQGVSPQIGTRRHRRRLGLPVCADRQGSVAGRPAQRPGLVRPLPADQGRWRRRSGQRRRLRQGVSGHRRPAPAGQLWRFAGASVAGDPRIEPRRRRSRRRARREGIHGARARLPQGRRRYRDAGAEERWRHAGAGARRRPRRDRPGRPARDYRIERRGRGRFGDRHGPLRPERARRDRQRQGQDRGVAAGAAGRDRDRSGL